MTGFQISGTPRCVGRSGKNDHSKSISLRFPPGLRERLDAVLVEGEDRTSMIQNLILVEVKRREKAMRAVSGKSDEPDLRTQTQRAKRGRS